MCSLALDRTMLWVHVLIHEAWAGSFPFPLLPPFSQHKRGWFPFQLVRKLSLLTLLLKGATTDRTTEFGAFFSWTGSTTWPGSTSGLLPFHQRQPCRLPKDVPLGRMHIKGCCFCPLYRHEPEAQGMVCVDTGACFRWTQTSSPLWCSSGGGGSVRSPKSFTSPSS